MRLKIGSPITVKEFSDFISVWYDLRSDRLVDYSIDGTLTSYPIYYYLNDEIYEWMQENKISYKLGYFHYGDIHEIHPDSYWYLDIEDKDKAVLFKLTWY